VRLSKSTYPHVVSERRAFAIYDARVVFSVDLDDGAIESADVYADTLRHFDTGFTFRPATTNDWRRLQALTHALVWRHRAVTRLRWVDDEDPRPGRGPSVDK
jgi:hypothetical protein